MRCSNVFLFVFLLSVSIVLGSPVRKVDEEAAEAYTEQRLREMLLTPNGESVNFEGLEEFAKILYKMDQADRSNRAVKPSSALNDLTMAGKQPAPSEGLTVSATCNLCATAFSLVGKMMTNTDTMWSQTMKLGKKLCQWFGHYSEMACSGMADGSEAWMRRAVPNILNSPTTVCNIHFKNCGMPDHQHNLWRIAIPDPPAKPILPPVYETPKKDKLTALFITDLHLDPDYQAGGAANCKEPLCCRKDSTPRNDPLPEADKAGYWGDYRMCNPPLWTFDDMLREINATHAKEIDYILLGGDVTPHNLWSETRQDVINGFKVVAEKIQQKLPGKPTFFALGNHDTIPVNSYSYPADPPQFSTQWLYDGLEDTFVLKWADPKTKDTIKKAGFYTTILTPGLRLVVLNDNFYYHLNLLSFDGSNISDAHGQLKWLVGLLSNAEATGERVIIMAHVHPGNKDCLPPYSWNYYRIADRFADVIVGQFFGHVHKDFYTIYYDALTLTKPRSVAFIGPPTTMFPLNNIAYRLYDFDPKTFNLLNYRQYYADIGKANANPDHSKMEWKFHYSAREEYALPDMSAASWSCLAARMQKDPTLYDKYKRHWNIDVVNTDVACKFECDRNEICEIYTALSQPDKKWCSHFMPADPAVQCPK